MSGDDMRCTLWGEMYTDGCDIYGRGDYAVIRAVTAALGYGRWTMVHFKTLPHWGLLELSDGAVAEVICLPDF